MALFGSMVDGCMALLRTAISSFYLIQQINTLEKVFEKDWQEQLTVVFDEDEIVSAEGSTWDGCVGKSDEGLDGDGGGPDEGLDGGGGGPDEGSNGRWRVTAGRCLANGFIRRPNLCLIRLTDRLPLLAKLTIVPGHRDDGLP